MDLEELGSMAGDLGSGLMGYQWATGERIGRNIGTDGRGLWIEEEEGRRRN